MPRRADPTRRGEKPAGLARAGGAISSALPDPPLTTKPDDGSPARTKIHPTRNGVDVEVL